MKSLKVKLLSGFLLFAVVSTYGQQVKEMIEGENGTPKFIKFESSNNKASIESQSLLQKYLPLSTSDQYQLVSTNQDQVGLNHEKFQQYYKGIKVENAVYSVHKKSGSVQSMNGVFENLSNSNLNETPTLSEEEALQKALAYIGAQKYMWENPDNENWAKKVEPGKTFYPHGELVYIKNYLTTNKERKFQMVLAYKFNVYAEKPMSRDFVYVDANTGEVVFKNSIIKTDLYKPLVYKSVFENRYKDNSGYGNTRYSGLQYFNTSISNNKYVLREYTRAKGIETYNMQMGINYYDAVDFKDNDNLWSQAEYNNSNFDNAALDAHWGAEKVYDYWMIKHGRNSYDNNGAAIYSFVHYNLIEDGYSDNDNAFWNGAVMTYGDGSSFQPLTCIDIIGHETGHAVTETTCNLVYEYESGALNEAFSDIWGACIEYFAAPDDPNKSTWLIGEEIGGPIRSMEYPKDYNQPDTYLGTNWYSGTADNGGVHTNSGVLNYWFYLLSQGGSGTNDNAFVYNVSGIGMDKAANIAYLAELAYLNAESGYKETRTATIEAASELYGAGSNEVVQVTNAWDAVGVILSGSAYCDSHGNNASEEWIARVKLGTIDNTSGYESPGYRDYTGIVAATDLSQNQSYDFTYQINYNGGPWNEYVKVWIDFNHDTVFSNDEIVMTSGAIFDVNLHTQSIFIPANSLLGNTRLRISQRYYSLPTSACQIFSFGEVEDYNINITAATSNGEHQAPTAPASLIAQNITNSSVNLSWNSSTDNVAVAGYKIYKNGLLLKSLLGTGTNTSIDGLSKSTSYSFYVKAFDVADNLSVASNTVNITTLGDNDTQAPTAPVNLHTTAVTQTSVSLEWNPSTDNVGVVKYRLYFNGSSYGYFTGTSALVSGLTKGTNYSFYVRAVDLANNQSGASNSVSGTTPTDLDNIPPSVPQNLRATTVTQTSVTLEWNPSTDNVGVVKYRVYFNGSSYGYFTGTSALVSGLTKGTNYTFYVRAIDPSNNQSGTSNYVYVTTPTDVDNIPPSVPQNLRASTVGQTDALLEWDPSTDNIGVHHYNIYKDGVFVTTSKGSGVVINGLEPTTPCYFTVTAQDDAGNISGESEIYWVLRLTVFPTYCTSSGKDQSDEWIDFVGFDNISNATGSNPYSNFTGSFTPVNFTPNSVHHIYFSAGFSGSMYDEYWNIWIDYNRDGVFNNSELVASGGPFAYDGKIQASFKVPATVLPGYTVMRVSMKYNSNSSPCEIFNYGEVEDYPINLTYTKENNSTSALSFANYRDINDPIEQQFVLFPNPAKESLTVVGINTSEKVFIYSTQGLLMKTIQLVEDQRKIDVSGLASGVYYIKFHNGRDYSTQKFIKN